ncbi:GPP34 family phosphoprotein [Klenkia brasiliensis]|uniref:Golgi phosphoprotein 3 (GPP34) n=1 Tax=Klenkia brasiliensis TaxID=333142 RepID=A0A1G7ZW09_9ACTN|nr:GPP34 family phosphoprotein [Klenkia brasiliensis]SDH12848.1 hypothetical protein SAMN05660324_4390 [Klenkia brasiliensis]
MEWATGATARVAALACDRKGRLLPQLLAADAVRCALVVDLALADRVGLADDHLALDTTPTGFAPADGLLAAIEVEPERALAGWFGERRIGLDQIAEALVADGAWLARDPRLGRTRYRPADPERLRRDLRTTLVGPDPAPVDAAVVALGRTAHLVGELRTVGYHVAPPDVADDVAAAGPLAWLLADAVAFLLERRARYRWGDTVLD